MCGTERRKSSAAGKLRRWCGATRISPLSTYRPMPTARESWDTKLGTVPKRLKMRLTLSSRLTGIFVVAGGGIEDPLQAID